MRKLTKPIQSMLPLQNLENIFISSQSTNTSEYRFIKSDEPEAEFKIIQPRTRGLE